jgi:hypothetical protein
MVAAYRGLLRLYSPRYRSNFGDEMITVFVQARADAVAQPRANLVLFYFRELKGLLLGALRERLWLETTPMPRRREMSSEFRFPRSTVVLMWLILGGVLLAIHKAHSIAGGPASGGYSLSVWPALEMMAAICFITLVVWGILFAARHTRIHRLAKFDPKA